MITLSHAAKEKNKRKAASKPATKGKPNGTSKATPSSSSMATYAPQDDAHEVIGNIPGPTPSSTEVFVAQFISQLDQSHHRGLDDLNFNSDEEVVDDEDCLAGEEEATEDAEKEETMVEAPTKGKAKNNEKNKDKVTGKRSANYSEEEDVALCHACLNVSLDASVGANQSKDRFWGRIEEYYNMAVTVPSYRTQGSLGYRWGTILECCN
jgi:hypothetical protein